MSNMVSGGGNTYLVGTRETLGLSVLFCNGVNTDLPGARRSAALVSQKFAGQQVHGFHNPTQAHQVWGQTVDPRVYSQFYNFILCHVEKVTAEEASSFKEGKVVIYCHSHGVVVTHEALKIASVATREKVRVYAFAGAALIPKSMATSVINIIQENDLIAQVGHEAVGSLSLEKLSSFFTRLSKARDPLASAEKMVSEDRELRGLIEGHHLRIISVKDKQGLGRGALDNIMKMVVDLVSHRFDCFEGELDRIVQLLQADGHKEYPMREGRCVEQEEIGLVFDNCITERREV